MFNFLLLITGAEIHKLRLLAWVSARRAYAFLWWLQTFHLFLSGAVHIWILLQRGWNVDRRTVPLTVRFHSIISAKRNWHHERVALFWVFYLTKHPIFLWTKSEHQILTAIMFELLAEESLGLGERNTLVDSEILISNSSIFPYRSVPKVSSDNDNVPH